VALACDRVEIAVAWQQLADAEFAQVGLVLGQRGGDDHGAGADAELDREAADSTGRADDEQRVALRQFQRVDCEHGSDAGHRCGADGREVKTRRNRRDGDVLWDGDQFGPATVATVGLAWRMKPKTSSPTAYLVTSGPTCSTTPA
jgi:hypothetical protein